jgi:hypothetical protein
VHDHCMFCSYTPEMYEPHMRVFSPHVSNGSADQQNSQPVAYQTPRFLQVEAAQDKRTGFHSRSILTAALAIGDRTLGVLQMRNKISQESFNENDNLVFLAYTAHVASVLDNTRLYARTKAMMKEREGSAYR